MKTNAKLLRDFILDFDLENVDGSVCFNANIEFMAAGIYKKMDSEIHLVSFPATGLSVFYLLNPGIAEHQLPDLITYDDSFFFYDKDQFLTAKGYSEIYGVYTLLIYPLERICNPETVKELNQKERN